MYFVSLCCNGPLLCTDYCGVPLIDSEMDSFSDDYSRFCEKKFAHRFIRILHFRSNSCAYGMFSSLRHCDAVYKDLYTSCQYLMTCILLLDMHFKWLCTMPINSNWYINYFNKAGVRMDTYGISDKICTRNIHFQYKFFISFIKPRYCYTYSFVGCDIFSTYILPLVQHQIKLAQKPSLNLSHMEAIGLMAVCDKRRHISTGSIYLNLQPYEYPDKTHLGTIFIDQCLPCLDLRLFVYGSSWCIKPV